MTDRPVTREYRIRRKFRFIKQADGAVTPTHSGGYLPPAPETKVDPWPYAAGIASIAGFVFIFYMLFC